ncbi:MAG: recombinase family protein [Solirubrobacteraceae bacterium]
MDYVYSDAHRGQFSVLVVWAVDRLCRQGIEELRRLIRELRERNVSLVSHREPSLNGSDATTELLAAMGCRPGVRPTIRADPRRAGTPPSSGQADGRRRLQARQRQAPAPHRGIRAGMGATQGGRIADATFA